MSLTSPTLNPLTEAEVKAALPAHLRTAVTPSLVQNLNAISADPLVAQEIRDNFVSYTGVLKEGKFRTEDYLNAVAYVSYKLMGHSNKDAYSKTFPARMNQLISKGTSDKDVSAYVSSYNKGKLVNLILEQTLVPIWVLNQDVYQKAINTQAELMATAASELVRTQAANSILTHLAKPKEAAVQINIGQAESSGMKELTDLMRDLAQQQMKSISTGEMKTVDVAAQRIIREPDE